MHVIVFARFQPGSLKPTRMWPRWVSLKPRCVSSRRGSPCLSLESLIFLPSEFNKLSVCLYTYHVHHSVFQVYLLTETHLICTLSLQVPGWKAWGADRHHLQPFDPDGCQHWRCYQDLALQQHETVECQLGDQDGREDAENHNLVLQVFLKVYFSSKSFHPVVKYWKLMFLTFIVHRASVTNHDVHHNDLQYINKKHDYISAVTIKA